MERANSLNYAPKSLLVLKDLDIFDDTLHDDILKLFYT